MGQANLGVTVAPAGAAREVVEVGELLAPDIDRDVVHAGGHARRESDVARVGLDPVEAASAVDIHKLPRMILPTINVPCLGLSRERRRCQGQSN